jgi:hypothetical protein
MSFIGAYGMRGRSCSVVEGIEATLIGSPMTRGCSVLVVRGRKESVTCG